MKLTRIPLPELALLSITRLAIGAGIGFLIAPTLSGGLRRQLGMALFGIGALATVPLALDVMRRSRKDEKVFSQPEMPSMPGARTNTRTDALAH
jgi:hypothetical protein